MEMPKKEVSYYYVNMTIMSINVFIKYETKKYIHLKLFLHFTDWAYGQ